MLLQQKSKACVKGMLQGTQRFRAFPGMRTGELQYSMVSGCHVLDLKWSSQLHWTALCACGLSVAFCPEPTPLQTVPEWT